MKTAFLIQLLLALCAAGCSSMAFVMTPRISTAITKANLDLPIEDMRAAGEWIPSYGHGLNVEVWAKRNGDDYKRNFDLELEGAARVCAALADINGILEWDFIDVYFTNKYEGTAPTSKKVCGVVRVIIHRENLRKLQENKVPASKYPQYWKLLHGYKDQPDSKALLVL
jgi:hypothetical protein